MLITVIIGARVARVRGLGRVVRHSRTQRPSTLIPWLAAPWKTGVSRSPSAAAAARRWLKRKNSSLLFLQSVV